MATWDDVRALATRMNLTIADIVEITANLTKPVKQRRFSRKAREFCLEIAQGDHVEAERILAEAKENAKDPVKREECRRLAEGLMGGWKPRRGAPVKQWRKKMRPIVLERIEKFPDETNWEVADFLFTNHDLRSAGSLETVA